MKYRTPKRNERRKEITKERKEKNKGNEGMFTKREKRAKGKKEGTERKTAGERNKRTMFTQRSELERIANNKAKRTGLPERSVQLFSLEDCEVSLAMVQIPTGYQTNLYLSLVQPFFLLDLIVIEEYSGFGIPERMALFVSLSTLTGNITS